MKLKRLASVQPAALMALGVFLGRGAQADTILNFNGIGTNIAIPQTFGDNALNSSAGVAVVGFGTPNIGLSWEAIGGEWEFYLDPVWQGSGQLNDSHVGDSHKVVFTPNVASGRAIIKSFNFHPYYNSTERFTYDISVLAGETVVSGPTTVTFLSDGTKNHPVPINYTGAAGETLELRIERVASTLEEGEVEGIYYDIAVDDVTFAQDPATVLGGPIVESVSPADDGTNVPATYSYRAGIRDLLTAVVSGSIQLKLDGSPVVPAPIISSAGGLTQVNFQAPGLLEGGSAHTYTLTYSDNGVPASNFTHEVNFTAANYVILPEDYASPSGSGSAPGFTYRTVLAALEAGATLPSTIARANEQLDGTLIDPTTDLPFENGAQAGPNPDGSFNVATVLDFDDDGTLSGNFQKDTRFPGLPTGPNDWFATKASMYLNLPAGYYRFGVNSDDGFEVSVGAPADGEFTSPTVLGFHPSGRAAGDTLFDFVVPTTGFYRFQVIYFESDGLASCEFFSVIPGDSAGKPILINDPDVANSIKSFRVLTLSQPPTITGVVRNGNNLMIEWVGGVAPFQVQFSGTLALSSWSNLGAPTSTHAATVPMQPGSGFVRVVGQ